MDGSLIASLASLSPTDRETVLAEFSDAELVALERDWRFLARPNQLPPDGDWTFWVVLTGRGFGKTWIGANWAHEQARTFPGSIGHLVAPTTGDISRVMLDGPAGIMAWAPLDFVPTYEISKHKLTWPNGSTALVFSAEEPRRLRGPQCHWGWADELAAWQYPEAWDQFLFGLRLGNKPRAIVTTTPRPIPSLKRLVADPATVVTRGSTYENRANLPASYFKSVIARYEGTRLGRQELNAEILDDVPGALWNRALLDQCRLRPDQVVSPYVRIVVAVDPAVTHGEEADETGIVVVARGQDGRGYVLEDASGRMPAAGENGWAARVIGLYQRHKADRVVAEVNNGGDLVEAALRAVNRSVAYTKVTASRGKYKRAEPVAALYEQGRVSHVGAFPAMEDQMCQMLPVPDEATPSPDRADALVWGLTELLVDERQFVFA